MWGEWLVWKPHRNPKKIVEKHISIGEVVYVEECVIEYFEDDAIVSATTRTETVSTETVIITLSTETYLESGVYILVGGG